MASKKKQLKKKSPATTEVKNKVEAGGKPEVQTDGGMLAVGDLKNISTIIDVASTRGAFRANEMATVGAMYNKLQQFLSKVAPEQKPEGTPTVGQAGAPTTVAPAPTKEK